ncbi:restriction endonuclease subunit S [Lacticaseibacillus paracasei]|uniref:restriction endonuclease subunit S n=1 Tax=Lacticaseibacillus paracasei TaxID=1597 RepID=UPI000FF356E5|nr:restriction endonuclease subunit S [Lacticaseibacillus paracasei]RND96511.1 EcoKI restriction-modification system protein HsdS [Lacticaseibacillus paracasei]RNE13134.1 EcoKI restriction-modification system protein HsdS [Lacticaseibacillus paracasei]
MAEFGCLYSEVLLTRNAWEKRKLGELAEFINGRAYKQDELLASGKYSVLRVGNFYTNDKWYYSNLELPEKYYAEEGDLLYTWSATFGPHIWIGPKVIYHYHIWKVALKNIFEKDFALQFFEADRVRLLNSTNGSTMIHVTKKDMESKGILLPDVCEQRTIGDLLKRVDHLIAATQDKLSFLKKMKMFFLQQIFPTKDHDVPQIRFDGFTDAWSHYKLGSLMRIDKEQEVKKELLTDIQKGFYVLAMRTFSMDGYIDHSKPYWLNCLDNVSDDKFLLPREFAILDADMDANLPKIGRVLLNASSEKYLLAAHVRKIQVKSGNDPIFIYALMRGNSVHERLKLEANGSISKRLLDKNVYKQSILVPNRSEQSKIGRLFFLLETTITLHQQKIQMLKQVKKSCLQNLFI